MKVLNNMKSRKASGIDNIPMELREYGGKALYIGLVRLFNYIWAQGKISSDWRASLLIPIHKIGDESVCSNYRGISLLATASKIYAAILKDKLKIVAEEKIEEQFGFRKGRSCIDIDAILVIKRLVEKRKEFNCPLHMLFLDYEKTYDLVNRQKLWKFLENYGVPKNLLNAIQNLHEITTNKIKLDHGKTTEAF
jgi:hypothetical protein